MLASQKSTRTSVVLACSPSRWFLVCGMKTGATWVIHPQEAALTSSNRRISSGWVDVVQCILFILKKQCLIATILLLLIILSMISASTWGVTVKGGKELGRDRTRNAVSQNMISECSKYSTYSFSGEHTLGKTLFQLHINKAHDHRKLVFQCRATDKNIGSKKISPNQRIKVFSTLMIGLKITRWGNVKENMAVGDACWGRHKGEGKPLLGGGISRLTDKEDQATTTRHSLNISGRRRVKNRSTRTGSRSIGDRRKMF